MYVCMCMCIYIYIYIHILYIFIGHANQTAARHRVVVPRARENMVGVNMFGDSYTFLCLCPIGVVPCPNTWNYVLNYSRPRENMVGVNMVLA